MSETDITTIVIALIVCGLAGLGILFRTAVEKERLWVRYQQLKLAVEREEELRKRRERAQQLIAKPADLLEEAGPDDPAAEQTRGKPGVA